MYTLDALALDVSGQDAEARKHIETALAVGVRDAKISVTLRDCAAVQRSCSRGTSAGIGFAQCTAIRAAKVGNCLPVVNSLLIQQTP
jgi:hypothetical protein